MPKKKTTSRQSLLAKLKLNTFKGRMIATILAFALVGGGIMVYRSFAATLGSAVFTAADVQYKTPPSNNGGLLVTELQQGAKKNTQVFEGGRYFYSTLHSDSTPNYVAKMDPLVRTYAGRSAQVCLTARGVDGNVRLRFDISGYDNSGTKHDLVFGPTYGTQCTPNFTLNNTIGISSFGAKAGTIGWQWADGVSKYRIASLTFQIVE